MINCPKCGTANIRGSRFCNACGELLPAYTMLVCPMCGAMNPIGNVYCDKCDARIVPMAPPSEEPEQERPPVKGLSLPTIPLEGKTEELAGEAAEEAGPEEGAEGDWLAQLRGLTIGEPTEGAEAGEEGAGDWLTQLRASAIEEAEGVKPEGAAEAVEPVELPQWLRGLGPIGAEAEVAPGEEEPAAEAPVEAVLEEQAPEPPAPAEVPDWLPELRPLAAEAEAAAPAEAVPEEPVPEPLAPAEVPAWLEELRPPEVEAEAAVPAEAVPEEPVPEPLAPGEALGWLEELKPPEAEAEAAIPAEAVPEEQAPEPLAPGEIPGWLEELRPPEAEAEAAVSAEAVPEEPVPEPLAPAGIPGWLEELESPEAEAEAAIPAEAVPEEPVSEPLAPGEIPGWLEELRPPEAEVEAVLEEPAPESLASAEVPDWLPEIALPEAAAVSEEPAPEAPAPAEIPDWLQGIAPEAEAEAAMPAEGVLEEPSPAAPVPAEIPDWLREIAPPEAAAAAAPAVRAVLEEPAPEAAAEPTPSVSPLLEVPEEAAAAAEVPAWLAALQREGAAPSAPDVSAFEDVASLEMVEAEGLARAEIPDWLEAMRPRAEVVREVVREEPLETEGLLEGLRGVLAPAPVTEMFQAREGPLPPEIGQVSLARARLLQSLLTRPAEAPQPDARQRGISMTAQVESWFVVLVLLATVAGALILGDLGYEVPILAAPDASEAETLHGLVEGVSEGEVVLVAFEYGPAEAGELDMVARPILRHLHDRGAVITIASTQPTGLAVAEALQSRVALQEHYTPTYHSAHYLPGGATGIADLLVNTSARPARVLVLAAQPAPLRWWIEQVHVWDKDVPLVAGVSAALEPVASPYLDDDAGQLAGAISGLKGAAAYEARRGVEGQTARQLNALAVGHAVVVALVVVGMVIHGVSGQPRRRG